MDLVSFWSGLRLVLVGGGAHVPPGDGFESIKVVYSHSLSSQIDVAYVTRLGTLLEICINNLFASRSFPTLQNKKKKGKGTETVKEQIHSACSLALIATDVFARGHSTKNST